MFSIHGTIITSSLIVEFPPDPAFSQLSNYTMSPVVRQNAHNFARRSLFEGIVRLGSFLQPFGQFAVGAAETL
jgi:hypothetical protein